MQIKRQLGRLIPVIHLLSGVVIIWMKMMLVRELLVCWNIMAAAAAAALSNVINTSFQEMSEKNRRRSR